jgi:flavin-dependent dehydrogenase
MQRADVLVVGGGPAGSSCATRLVTAGLDVVVLDRARFPRDKPCAGWITPEVVEALSLDLAAYAARHTLQPITGFRVGWVGGEPHAVDYRGPVSYAIRRCELDTELLRRSGARLQLGEAVTRIARVDGAWRVNDGFTAPWLVGAGGHFCPVARMLRRTERQAAGAEAASASGQVSRRGGHTTVAEPLVVAREMEVRLPPREAARCPVEPQRPELYFTSDLAGYGWCLRKGEYLNVGLGRRDTHALQRHLEGFLAFLASAGRLGDLPGVWRGHAYRLREGRRMRLVGDGVLLVGDAAGLAHAASGEGILSAVLSGQLAAEVLLEAAGDGGEASLGSYAARLTDHVGPWSVGLPRSLARLGGRLALSSAWLTRHLVLDRLFLHRRRPLTPS